MHTGITHVSSRVAFKATFYWTRSSSYAFIVITTLVCLLDYESLVPVDSAHPPGDRSKYEGADVEKGVDAGYYKMMT